MAEIWRLGVDIGGTFTDLVLESSNGVQASTKVLTTYDTPEDAIITGLQTVCKQVTIQPDKISQIIIWLILSGWIVTCLQTVCRPVMMASSGVS